MACGREVIPSAALIQDYELSSTPGLLSALEGIEHLKQIQGALRLSAHVLAEDAELLAGQLWGRLFDAGAPETRRLLDQAKKVKAAPWLRPLNPSLRHPSDQLVRTLAGHTDEVRAVVLTPDGR